MPMLQEMPVIDIEESILKEWGKKWRSDINSETGKTKIKDAFDRKQSVNFCTLFDWKVGESLAAMLGNIEAVPAAGRSLLPPQENCVEVGPARVIGGIRPQNYDVAYRPDGVRFAFDSKSLNDKKSVAKNWQNMINDLGTESATVHTRFPYAVVGFMVVIPRPALAENQERNITRTLERLGTRKDVLDQTHLAEAISLVVWDPETGLIDANSPSPESNLRIESFSQKVYETYLDRYKGLPPHED